MPDFSQNIKPENQQKGRQKNPIFLVLALISISLTVAAYIYEAEIIYYSNDWAFAWALLLLLLVVSTLFFMMCYRNPAIGEKLTGKAPDIDHPDQDKSSYHYTGFTKTDSASDEKILNSNRKKARSTRKHYAAVTREMQSDAKDDKPEE